jgi:hypothetical protein
MISRLLKSLLLLSAVLSLFTSCSKSDSLVVNPITGGNVSFGFLQQVNGSLLAPDTLAYSCQAGHSYMVNDLQYFISDVALHRKNGAWCPLNPGKDIHYVDIHLQNTLTWNPGQDFTFGDYDSLSFTLGLSAENNISNRFPDPPERDMFWPAILGGGYHYMKMNMKYRNPADSAMLMPFMFHLGIGQVYMNGSMNPDSIIGYVQNYFTVKVPVNVTVGSSIPAHLMIVMDIAKWIDGEYTFDFSDYTMGIMQNQEGMFKACRNGRHAFSAYWPVK